MAEYLILVCEDEAAWTASSREEQDSLVAAHRRFADELIGELGGVLLNGKALEPTSAARSVRSGIITDGPFVETKEHLLGFYLIEAKDMDHALAIARFCPSARGGVEVRQTVAL